MQYRKELKYFINYIDYLTLTNRLKSLFSRDANSREGGYSVRSLYFDNKSNIHYYHKLAGISERKKYRIRIYNLDTSPVKLEVKSKRESYIHKISASLDYRDLAALIEGNYGFLLGYHNRVANLVYAQFLKDSYRPVVIIDYYRDAYYYSPGNIRVTFDSRLAKNETAFEQFLNKDLELERVLGHRKMIMEIKFNQGIPLWIKNMLQVERFESCAISKYTLSRYIEG